MQETPTRTPKQKHHDLKNHTPSFTDLKAIRTNTNSLQTDGKQQTPFQKIFSY